MKHPGRRRTDSTAVPRSPFPVPRPPPSPSKFHPEPQAPFRRIEHHGNPLNRSCARLQGSRAHQRDHHLARRRVAHPRDCQGVGLRPRPPLRRRRLRGHPCLRRQDLPARGTPRPSLRLGPGHLALGPDAEGGDDCRHRGGRAPLRAVRGLHSPHRHPWCGRPGPEPEELSSRHRHHHRGHDRALAGGHLRDRTAASSPPARPFRTARRFRRGSSRSTTSRTSWPRARASSPAWTTC